VHYDLVHHLGIPFCAGLGLRTQGGVRRSSRNHHRPLEYWRNEKKVYTARDHTSASPAHVHLMIEPPCLQQSRAKQPLAACVFLMRPSAGES
jgi:hypothetical protein